MMGALKTQIFYEAGRGVAPRFRDGDRSFLRVDTFEGRGLVLFLKRASDRDSLALMSVESGIHENLKTLAGRALALLEEGPMGSGAAAPV